MLHQRKQKKQKAKKVKKAKTSFSKAKIEKIRKEFNESRYKFSELKIKEIRENLYEIENEKNLSESKINVRDLFDLSIDEDYYEPIIVKTAFDSNYIQYESKGDKGKNLSIKRYLKMIKPYLSDLINNH